MLCDNIGPVLVCLPSGSTDVTTSPSRYMTQPSGIPILSPVLFMHVGDPYIPLLKFVDLLVGHETGSLCRSLHQLAHFPKSES